MIRINLYPLKKKRKKPKPVPDFVVASVILLVLSFIVSVYINYFMKSKIKNLTAQKQANVEKITSLNEKIKEVKNFETLNKTFDDRKKIIEDLRRNQSKPVKILDELSARLTDGVWLSNLSVTGDSIDFDGYGFTNDDVVAFVQNLKASPLFTDVYLHETAQGTSDGVTVYSFKISMKAKADG